MFYDHRRIAHGRVVIAGNRPIARRTDKEIIKAIAIWIDVLAGDAGQLRRIEVGQIRAVKDRQRAAGCDVGSGQVGQACAAEGWQRAVVSLAAFKFVNPPPLPVMTPEI